MAFVPAIAGGIAMLGAAALESAGLSAIAGEAALALGAGETVAGFVGSATVAKGAQKIQEYAEKGINSAIDALVPEKTQKDFQDTFNDLFATYNAHQSQDPSYFLQKQHEQKQHNKNLEMRLEDDEGEELGPVENPFFNKDKVLPYGGNPLVTNADTDQSTRYSDRSEGDERGNVLTSVQKQKDTKTRNIGAAELARFIVGFSTDLSFNKNPEESLKQFVEKNPSQLDTIERMNQFLANKSLPTSQEFMNIYKVYNGRNINASSFSIARNDKGLIVVSAPDELGVSYSLEENTGYTLPSVPPYVFTGPFSKNNQLPTNSPVDWFSFFHDWDYKAGFFDRIGDMKFISRLSQNKDRMTPSELNFANSTIIYFSNISMTLGSIFGSQNPEQISKGPQQNIIMDDIFPAMNPDAIALPAQEYQTLRYKFYDELEQSLAEESVTSSLFSQISNSSVTSYFAEEFGEMLIQVV